MTGKPQGAAKKRRRRKALLRQSLLAVCALALVCGVTVGVLRLCGVSVGLVRPASALSQQQAGSDPLVPGGDVAASEEPAPPAVPLFESDEKTVVLTDEIDSEYGLIADAQTGRVLAEKLPDAQIYPASMTKVLTLLTGVELLPDLEQPVTMTAEIIDPLYRQGATITGLKPGETVPLRDLLYGGVLRSAADATQAIAIAACGSEEAFVTKMNEKLAQLGLSDTAHFTNTSGLYQDTHVCTVRDMAVMMAAAMQNPLCAQILSTENYTSTPTEQNPEGVLFTNKFLYRMSIRQPENVTITAGKNGYVSQALSCLVSYAQGSDGRTYLCVTARATTSWTAINDHIKLYTQYAK